MVLWVCSLSVSFSLLISNCREGDREEGQGAFLGKAEMLKLDHPFQIKLQVLVLLLVLVLCLLLLFICFSSLIQDDAVSGEHITSATIKLSLLLAAPSLI